MTAADGSQKKTRGRSFWKRKSVRIVGCLILLAAALLISLPIGTRLYLEKWLVDNGADSATIEKVRLNLFTGVAALEGVDVRKNGQTVFSNTTVFLNVGLKNLLGREALLQRATVANFLIDIERSEDGSMRVGSYTIPSSEAKGEDSSAEPAEKSDSETLWIFHAQTVSLKNVVVHYRQPDLDLNLVVEEALLEKFTTDPKNNAGALTLKATLNGAPITLDLPRLVVAPLYEVKGNITAADMRLEDLSGVLKKYLNPFSGAAGLQGEIAFVMDDSGMRVDYDGLVELQNGEIGGKGWATKGVINYHGKGAFEMAPGKMVVDVDGSLQAQKAAFDMPDPMIAIDNPEITINGKTTVTIGDEVIVDSGASLNLASTTVNMDILKTATGVTTWNGAVRVETGTDTKGLLVKADGKLQVANPQYSMGVNSGLMEVDSQVLAWNGQVEYAMGTDAGASDYVRTNGTMQAEATTFLLPEVVQATQKGLNLKGKTEVAIGREIGVSYDGEIKLDQSGVEAAAVAAGNRQLSWAGKVDYLLGDKRQTIGFAGNLEGEEFFTDIGEADLHINQQSLKTKAGFSLVLEDSLSFTGTASLDGSGLEIRQKDAVVLTLSEISIPEMKENGSGGVVVDSLDLAGLAVPSSQDIPVTANIANISLTGLESADFASARAARLTITQPEIIDGEGTTQLAHLDAITAEDIAIDEALALAVGQITATKGLFLMEKGKKPAVSLDKLNITKIHYSPEAGFTGDAVELDSLSGDIHRQKADDRQVEEKAAENASPAPENVREPKRIPVKIRQINVAGESGFTFTDETLAQTFITDFAVKSLQVNDIDLTQPDHPFSYSLEGAFDKYSPLRVTGKSAPLAANIFVEQEATLKNYSMMHASPYAIESIGTYFPNGTLDYTSTLKLGDGKIQMKNNLVFKDLETETVDGELAGQLNNQLPVPLDLALSMLRDSAGTIDLDVPLEGELADFHVGIADIVITVLSKGITSAVTPYLAYTALGPAGALVFLGTKAGQSMMNTDLPSLEFELKALELNDKQKEILDKIGKKIEKEDEDSYTICARVSVDEISGIDSNAKVNQGALVNEAIRKELFELGESRSLTVKKYLVDTFKIGEERLLICNPGIEFESGVKPKIEFRQ